VLEGLWKDCVFGWCGVKAFERRIFGPMASRTPRAATRGWRNCAQWFRGMPRHGSLLFFAVLLVACAQSPVQPTTACAGTHTLYVVSHGWHSGIVVDRAELVQRVPALAADIGQDGYVEVGWGEVHFYLARETNALMALRAVLRPNAAVLQVVPFAEAPRRYFAQSEVVEVRTDEAGYAHALDFIAATFKPELRRLGPSLYGSGWFYGAEGSFHLFNTCNSWVAAAIDRAMRCSG
jgi:uncharacterized protein (TIGR02117 family)